jgi:hypothetical protein
MPFSKVDTTNIFEYVGQGSFVMIFTILLLACLVQAMFSRGNKLLSIQTLLVTTLFSVITCGAKLIQLGSRIVHQNVTEKDVLNAFSFTNDIVAGYFIPVVTLALAYIHMLNLARESITSMTTDSKSYRRRKPIVPRYWRGLCIGTIVFFMVSMICTVVPGIVLKALSVFYINDPKHGITSASTGFQNFFDALFLIHMAVVGFFTATYAHYAQKSNEYTLTDDMHLKRVYIFYAYIIIFMLYKIFTYLTTSGNVLLVFYLLGTLVVNSNAVCNFFHDREDHDEAFEMGKTMDSFEMSVSALA